MYEQINEFLNIGSSNISKLAIFIFIIAGNYAGDTFSCNLRHIIRDNMIAKHILGIFIVLIFIGFSQDNLNILNKIYLSIFLYTWYIFIMRSPTPITLAVIGIIIILYILQEAIKDIQKNIKDNSSEVDTKNSQYKINFYTKIRNALFLISILLSTVGIIIYYQRNKNLFKNDFSTFRFLVGVNDKVCFGENK
jgi:Ca2+/Na+ antiporter